MANLTVKNFLTRLYTKSFTEEDLASSAAQVAFYFAFALFPLLLFFVSLFGLVLESANDLRTEMFFYLRQVMPLSAYNLVETTINEVTQNSSGGKLTIGILIAIWSASAGIDSVRVALNGVYNLTEKRSYWQTKLTALLMTLGLGILITIALGGVFYGSKFTLLILNTINLPVESPFVLAVLQWIIVLVVLVTIFAIIYNFLPQHKKHAWVWISPGTIAGIVLWLLLSYSFRLYLGYFNSYDKTYGSLGAMIILMLWLYLTALVILVGGSINAVLQEFTDPETADAGANKAAAQKIVDNPDKQIKKFADDPEKLLETAPQVNDRKEFDGEKSPSTAESPNPPDQPVISAPTFNHRPEHATLSEKPALNLLIGSVFGVLFGWFFSKRKRKD